MKKLCELARLDVERYGAHSLRAGFVTQALRYGAQPHEIAKVTRHKRLETVLKYARAGSGGGERGGKDPRASGEMKLGSSSPNTL